MLVVSTVAALLLLLDKKPSGLEASLGRVPGRRHEWKTFLTQLPKEERAGGEFLLTYMPVNDLRNLPTSKVREALDLSYRSRRQFQWAKAIPSPIFYNNVLPYVNLTEPRRSMRAEFYRRYAHLVEGAQSPGEAALLINQTLFRDYKVTYNTHRLRTDQSPPETIAQGMATCTGLSIMLVDALRAVGIPARVAGINSWPGRGGNHTWVEVWDKGNWHFVGAAEPDRAGLDHAWFGDEAGRAIASKPLNSIWAVSYRDTGTFFPMVWAPNQQVPAVNVTDRYNKRLVDLTPRLMVEVKERGERVIADVIAYNAATGDKCLIGKSKGPHADINLHLSAPVQKGTDVLVVANYEGKSVTEVAKIDGDTVVHLDLSHATESPLAGIFADRFGASSAKREAATKLLAKLPYTAESAAAAWDALKSLPDPILKQQFDANIVATADRKSPYLWRKVGEKPSNGWGLVIAMHGGGGVPKGENDSEWHYMFTGYYKDHPEAGGYIYLALRAPNDAWNGFYDDAISPLVERLIWQFVKYAGVDPNRVYACGASHGGYGAFVIGPKIPYRFAAVHPAASAGTPGETEGENLRNVRFTWSVGERDDAYNRVDLCREFQKQWDEWKAKYGGFDGGVEVVAGHGHLVNDFEANKTAELLKYSRNVTPKSVIWVQTDSVLRRFYWIESQNPVPHGRIEASIEGNIIRLTTKNQGVVTLWLSSKLVDVTKPVWVIRDGKQTVVQPVSSLGAYLDSLEETLDPALAAPVRIDVQT